VLAVLIVAFLAWKFVLSSDSGNEKSVEPVTTQTTVATGQVTEDPANPGLPNLLALDAQIRAANADGVRVILMPYRYPGWVNGTAGIVPGSDADVALAPQDRLAPGRWTAAGAAARRKALVYRLPAASDPHRRRRPRVGSGAPIRAARVQFEDDVEFLGGCARPDAGSPVAIIVRNSRWATGRPRRWRPDQGRPRRLTQPPGSCRPAGGTGSATARWNASAAARATRGLAASAARTSTSSVLSHVIQLGDAGCRALPAKDLGLSTAPKCFVDAEHEMIRHQGAAGR
jgi:hypothetical protein